jgi:nucleoid-associated protein YgaU
MSATVACHRGSAHASARCHRSRRSERLSRLELLILAVALVAVVGAAVLPSLLDRTEAPLQTRTIIVRRYDSLWDIARAHPREGFSTAQTVTLIRRFNHLEQSALTPGQLLRVPADEAGYAADARP